VSLSKTLLVRWTPNRNGIPTPKEESTCAVNGYSQRQVESGRTKRRVGNDLNLARTLVEHTDFPVGIGPESCLISSFIKTISRPEPNRDVVVAYSEQIVTLDHKPPHEELNSQSEPKRKAITGNPFLPI
jgi:hypothetical protein